MKRKDEWSYEEDLLLAQTVLEHISSKSTQLQAFEEVAERLSRSAAACGFRWNSAVRKQYEEQIKDAKKLRKDAQRKAELSVNSRSEDLYVTVTNTTSETPFDPLITSLLHIKEEYILMQQTINNLRNQVSALTAQLEAYKHKVDPSEDMNSLMQIIKRAERLGLFDKFTPKEKPAG